jgi:hypothetical protein
MNEMCPTVGGGRSPAFSQDRNVPPPAKAAPETVAVSAHG